MSINNALQFLANQSGRPVSKQVNISVPAQNNYVMDSALFREANQYALDEVAKFAVAIVKNRLSRPYDGVSSRGGEPPKQRTGTLRNSIHWRRSKGSREFPGPIPRDFSKQSIAAFRASQPEKYQWYKRIVNNAYEDKSIIKPYPSAQSSNSLVRVIEVDPSATDLSDRGRLEYYSYYLETGWQNAVNTKFRDKGNARGNMVKVPHAEPADLPDGSGWNPPRPYLMLLSRPGYKAILERVYQRSLANRLPNHLQYMAYKARLKIVYNRALRVPYLAENKGLL